MTSSPRITTPKRAAAMARTTAKTIRKWCRTHGIGRRVAGRWWVDTDRLETLIKGGVDGR